MYLRTATYVLYARRASLIKSGETRMRVRGKGTRDIFQGRRLQGPKLKFPRERAPRHLQGRRLKFPRERAPRRLQGRRLRSPARGAQRYDIRTVPRLLVPTSPAPVPTILHQILVNDATAEVPRVMTARSSSAHSSPRTPAFKPQVASALLSL